jgi:hypothetical protein
MGYAGAGGQVNYMDLTTSVAGDTITVVVGSGGAYGGVNPGGDGGDSSVSVNGGTPAVTYGGMGGDSGASYYGWCSATDGYYGENVGAGSPFVAATGEACIGGGPGIVPDSDSNAPAIFDGYTDDVARGGGVFIDTFPSNGTGDGGSVYVDTNGGGTSDDVNYGGPGVWGTVIFRYPAADANNAPDEPLAPTGGALPTTFAALASVAIIAAGIGFRPFNRRRSRASR